MMTNSSSWQNSESKHMHIGYIPTTWPDLTLIWRFLPSLTPIWPNLTSNNLDIEFMTKFWVETYAYWLYSDYLAGFDPNLTRFTLVWPLLRLLWPQTILNLNSGQNSESKQMYIRYISTYLHDLTLIWRLWPKFDPTLTSWWPDSASKNFEFEFWTKFRVETNVCWVYFD